MELIKKYVGKTEAFVIALVLTVAAYAAFCAKLHCFKAVFLCLVCIASLSGFWAWYRWLRTCRENVVDRFVFPAALLILGTVSVFFIPAGSVPDEFLHYFHSYEYASALMGWDSHTVRVEDLCAFVQDGGFLSRDIGVDGWNYVKQHIGDATIAGTISLESLTGINPQALADVGLFSELPQLRLFSALGIALGRVIGLNHVAVFYLGRLFNMILAVALIIFAVRVAPIGKNIMMVIALFPMSIHLIGSYSYDAGTIGWAFLCTAYALKIVFENKTLSAKTLIVFLMVVAVAAPCKPVYIGLAYIVLFAPSSRFPAKRDAWIFRIAVVLLSCVAVAMTRLGDVSGVVAGGSSDGVAYFPAGRFFSDPAECIVMLVNTVETLGSFWLLNIPGDSLGWFQTNTSFPDYVACFLLLVLSIASIRSLDDERVLPIVARCGFGVLFLICSFGIILSMWLSWTQEKDVVIQGVQGRYFIPLLPMLMLALRPNGIRANYSLGFPLVAAVFATTLCGFAYISIKCLVV